jgi:hypothetical protein
MHFCQKRHIEFFTKSGKSAQLAPAIDKFSIREHQMQINVYSSMLFTMKVIIKMRLFFISTLLRSLHIFVSIFFWLQALCIGSAQGQEIFPPSFNFLLDEQLFLQSDLRSNGFQTVTCIVTDIKFASLSKIDTVATCYFETNEKYGILSYISKYLQYQTTDSCFFSYLPNDEVVKTCKFFVKAKSGDFSKDTMWGRCAIRYKENKMLSKKTINYLVGLSRVAFEKTDTFFYQKGLLYKSVTYWKGFEKDIQVDSIITNYSYDSLNNLKSLLVLPSVNFIKNFPPQKYNTYSLKVNYFYKYDADTIIHTKFNYYDYLPALLHESPRIG